MKKFEDDNLRGVVVVARPDESIQSLIKRFKKKVEKNGILRDIKKHMYFEKPSKCRKIKDMEAESRRKKEEIKKTKGRYRNEKDSSDK